MIAAPGLGAWLILSALLFMVGLYGVLSRRNLVGILLSVELMTNAVNLNLVAFAHAHGDILGQVFALFSVALTVAEVGVGLALVILVFRSKSGIDADDVDLMRG